MRLLVVEDADKLAGAVEHRLWKEGYALDTLADGRLEARLRSRHDEYDLVVVDVVLPRHHGGRRAGPEHDTRRAAAFGGASRVER